MTLGLRIEARKKFLKSFGFSTRGKGKNPVIIMGLRDKIDFRSHI
jgi:hypothetical protein